MSTTENKTKNSGKLSSLFTIVLYNIGNLIFLVSIILHLPFLIDTVNFDGVYEAFEIFNKTYLLFDIGASLAQLACVIAILCIFGSRRFPTELSLATSITNFITCTFFSVLIYIVDLKDVYFSLQILYLIPIITIFLSSIFLYDDLFDLLRNRYRPSESELEEKRKSQKKKDVDNSKHKKAKKKKGELKSAERPDENALIMPEDSFFNQQKIISSAAERAIPDLNNTETKTESKKIDN